ncbi:hypothetical protein HMPREF0645_0995 [Hallella bergensis DSM 17361]|uniref:Uncharacterized protein n=1 Tax=Hallella bergensis DSM 17361 TaxID=585502 RepID=D1PVL0_9BACT|nr:hypothetical protein HMPREF0645_0995 [Hallella bergensis DSM 17361]
MPQGFNRIGLVFLILFGIGIIRKNMAHFCPDETKGNGRKR